MTRIDGGGARRTARVLLALVLATLLGGCVSVPSSGPVIRGDQSSARSTSQVEIAAQPPAVNSSPRAVVDGFLQAMAAYEPDYATARLYLAPSVRDTWQPMSGVTVYADGHAVTEAGGTVTLSAPVTGRVDARGAFTPVKDRLTTDFGLQRGSDGQWRITDPPEGLLVSQFIFDNFFQHPSLYWPEPGGQYLVPDPISLAQGRRTATTLVRALLAGPGDWIAPAVSNAVPAGTTLRNDVGVGADGVATVDLSGPIDTLDTAQRRLLAGQLTWTLAQLPTVTGVKVLHDGAAYALGDLTGQNSVVPVGSLPNLAPVPPGLDNHLFAIDDHKVVRVDQSDQTSTVVPIPGPFGQSGTDPEGLAVTASADTVAVVTEGGTRLTTVDLAAGTTSGTFAGFTRLLRPQYARTGELWLVSGEPGQQKIQVAQGDRIVGVDAGDLTGTRISNFRISPDGVRMALVIERDGHTVLALARVDRQGGSLRVEGLQVIPLALSGQSQLTSVSDVGWSGPMGLVVLGSGQESTQPSPYRLDLSTVAVQQIGQPDGWQARSIATLPNPESTRMVIVGDRTGAWRYEDVAIWPHLSATITAAAYPG
ncbi:LpqB family beta-propeller domain-containing protein [Raineyella sp. LH-20]|uniref:LpqB family beta-propeller domain-containing protein n=1 Tax=Raineyella sp. LH-20 TaxID=3081204 RepID=UPI0029551FA6|nr:LpqB family beta-propeller domain-containing protein [Raineyella sp. LH-20]WOP17864.1 LpqB family beta-propeller domain-containing protein [Raineyella sp. LH-20]